MSRSSQRSPIHSRRDRGSGSVADVATLDSGSPKGSPDRSTPSTLEQPPGTRRGAHRRSGGCTRYWHGPSRPRAVPPASSLAGARGDPGAAGRCRAHLVPGTAPGGRREQPGATSRDRRRPPRPDDQPHLAQLARPAAPAAAAATPTKRGSTTRQDVHLEEDGQQHTAPPAPRRSPRRWASSPTRTRWPPPALPTRAWSRCGCSTRRSHQGTGQDGHRTAQDRRASSRSCRRPTTRSIRPPTCAASARSGTGRPAPPPPAPCCWSRRARQLIVDNRFDDSVDLALGALYSYTESTRRDQGAAGRRSATLPGRRR